MPDLATLNLTESSTPQVDWDAPEMGSFPPPCVPGSYTGIFHMPEKPEDWFDVQEVEIVKGQPKERFLKFFYEVELLAALSPTGQETPIPPGDDGKQPRLIKQNASFFKTGKMLISFGAEVMRALGIRISGSLAPQTIQQALGEVSGKVRLGVSFDVAWRTYFKSTETTISTRPRTKKGDIPWPRKQDGSFEDMAVNPQTGEKAYGFAEIVKVHLPKAL